MPRLPDHAPPPLVLNKTPEEIIAMGERMGVPEISVEYGVDHLLKITYHWDHGDRVIYPQAYV